MKSEERKYIQRVGKAHRKKYAQFFTPNDVADVMGAWLLGNTYLRYVLDPSFGLGTLSKAILAKKGDVRIKGYDIDPIITEEARKIFSGNERVEIINEDYIFNGWDNRYDGITCNPPYQKFHDYENKEAISELKRRLNYDLTGFTNIYTLFLLKSLTQLNENGRCAYIVPLEFLNADYGTVVKSLLLRTGMLRHIIVFDFKANIFDDAITTSCIVLCENNTYSNKVHFSFVKSKDDFRKLSEGIGHPDFEGINAHTYLACDLDPHKKWKNYYQPQELKLKGLVPFVNYAKVMRGIATGDNDYFTFTKDKAEKYSINETNLLPCICHSIDVRKNIFTIDDYNELVEVGKKTYLFDAGKGIDDNAEKYIALGVETGVNKRYLTSKRRPWYALENRKPAPIWVSVFNRSGLRFIRNKANISNLTTFHCIYPANDMFRNVSSDLLYAYLITDTASRIFEMNAREYGNGLSKFEPNDLNKAMMLDINALPENDKKEMLRLYDCYTKDEDHCHIRNIDSILMNFFG